MNKVGFASILFFFFSAPLLGWISKPGNDGFLLVLIPVGITVFGVSGLMNRTKSNLVLFSILYLVVSIGISMLLQKEAVGFTVGRMAMVSLGLASILIVLPIVADIISLGRATR